MKKLTKRLSVLLCAVLLLSVSLAFTACGEKVIVTFDHNYEGGASTTAKVTPGDKVSEPDAPTRDGYTFITWCTDKTGMYDYSFDAPVDADLVLYAKWRNNNATYYAVTFNQNYTGAPAAVKQDVEGGTAAVAPPTDPSRTDSTKLSWQSSKTSQKYEYDFTTSAFAGWYTDAAGTAKYDFSAPVTQDIVLYAKWDTTYDFEAELIDLTGKYGSGYSFSVTDEQLIMTDLASRNQNANMGYSVAYMYQPDLFIDFKIYAETAVEDAQLTARLTSEFYDTYISSKGGWIGNTVYAAYTFKVNGGEAIEYAPIALTGTPERGQPNQRQFDNWDIGKISLNAGWNTIRLTVDNATELGDSTLKATAPLVDCLYITTNGVLSWEPKWENMDKVEDPTD